MQLFLHVGLRARVRGENDVTRFLQVSQWQVRVTWRIRRLNANYFIFKCVPCDRNKAKFYFSLVATTYKSVLSERTELKYISAVSSFQFISIAFACH